MISSISDSGLPRLGWIGSIKKSSLAVTVYHGSDVEIADNFIVEGVWEGKFELGDFHRAEHFFGSGLKLEEDGVWLVPSTALVDRLFFCEDDDNFFVSNSLVCLLAYLDAELEASNNYKNQSDNILMGVDSYDRSFPISHPDIKILKQIYYTPIKLTKEAAEYQQKDTSSPFESYDEYYFSLRTALKAIRANSKSSDRKTSLLAYTTISRGYDSTAVTTLVGDLDIRKAFTSQKSSSGFASWMNPNAAIDDGTEIAKQLGIEVSYLDYTSTEIGEDETKFICPTPAEPEIIFYKAYRELSENAGPSIMFTGYHGDKLWNRVLDPKSLERSIFRGDTSGVNLGEARLDAAFINIPVPFMYAREISSIHSISNSDELKPWSIGGYYDRPIPRRLAEEKGISREMFGIRKKTVITFYGKPKNIALRKQFNGFLKKEYGIGRFRYQATTALDLGSFYFEKILKLIGTNLGFSLKPTLTKNSLDIPYKMHIWSLHYEIDNIKEKLNNKRENK